MMLIKRHYKALIFYEQQPPNIILKLVFPNVGALCVKCNFFSFAIGAKYALASDACIRAKVFKLFTRQVSI